MFLLFRNCAKHVFSLGTKLLDMITSLTDLIGADLVNSVFIVFIVFQLFRRVAAALPGMESMQETSKEGSILWPTDKSLFSYLLKSLFMKTVRVQRQHWKDCIIHCWLFKVKGLSGKEKSATCVMKYVFRRTLMLLFLVSDMFNLCLQLCLQWTSRFAHLAFRHWHLIIRILVFEISKWLYSAFILKFTPPIPAFLKMGL